jgi:cell division inhibitor SepF
MGLMDELKRLARPYEDEDEFEEQEAKATPIREEKKVKEESESASPAAAARTAPARAAAAVPEQRGRKVVNINTTTQLKVVLVRPERFEDASEIADHLRDKRTVVLNLESTEKDVGRRLVDFLSGVAYAQEGKIKKVAVSTYIITPYNVDIIGSKSLLDELESSGAYTFN